MDFFNDFNPYLVRENDQRYDIDDNIRQVDPFEENDSNFRRNLDIDFNTTIRSNLGTLSNDNLKTIENAFVDFRQDGNMGQITPPTLPEISPGTTPEFTPEATPETTPEITPPPNTSGLPIPPITPIPIIDQSYVENILRLNVGKLGTFYFTYSGSEQWRDKTYKGVIEQAGRDHFVIHDPKNGKRYLLQYVYFDWAEFDEEINYHYPINSLR